MAAHRRPLRGTRSVLGRCRRRRERCSQRASECTGMSGILRLKRFQEFDHRVLIGTAEPFKVLCDPTGFSAVAEDSLPKRQ